MKQLPDAPWIREAERLGYPVGGERVPELRWFGAGSRRVRFFQKTESIKEKTKRETRKINK